MLIHLKRACLVVAIAAGLTLTQASAASGDTTCEGDLTGGVYSFGCQESGSTPGRGTPPGHSVGPVGPPGEAPPPPECGAGSYEEEMACLREWMTSPEVWAVPPPGAPAPPPTPIVLARRALATLQLPTPELGLTPPPNATTANTLVRTPTHLWLTETGSAQTGPHAASASDAGLTVTISARLSGLTLAADEAGGGERLCAVAALAGPPANPFADPACGHVWQTVSRDAPGGVHHLIVTHHWDVAWQGGGESGTLTAQTTATYPVAVTDRPVTLR